MGHGTWDVFRDPACVAFPETVDFVLILVDSKCNFVTCEFVTISTSNNRSRKVILIYNILYIYIKYYYLLFVISSSFLIFLPLYRTSLMSQFHMSQSITFSKCIFPDQVDSFSNCSNCSFVCLFAPISHTLYTSNAQSAAFRSALGSPPLKGRGPWQGGRGKQTMQPRFANYGTLCYKLWQFLVESASNADSGNVILW